jgi:hypothetical protein
MQPLHQGQSLDDAARSAGAVVGGRTQRWRAIGSSSGGHKIVSARRTASSRLSPDIPALNGHGSNLTGPRGGNDRTPRVGASVGEPLAREWLA